MGIFVVQCGHSRRKTLELTTTRDRIRTSVMYENKEEVDMKKILACISLVFALSASVTALADEVDYTAGYADGNQVTIDASNKNTILITDPGDVIVYADQTDDSSGFGNMAFLLKGASLTKDVKYTVTMNNSAGTSPSTGYIMLTDPKPETTPMGKYEYKTDVREDGTYDAGYSVGYVENANKFTKAVINVTVATNSADQKEGTGNVDIVFSNNSGVTGSFPQISGGVTNLGIKIINIPEYITINSVSLVAE